MKRPSSPAFVPVAKARRFSPLTKSIAALLCAASATAQTYTSTNSGTFTNPLVWNLGAGPVPASDAALVLTIQSYGAGETTVGNDLNLTLNQLDLATYRASQLTLSGSSLNGDYAFTGGAGTVNLLGSGQFTTLSAGVVLGQGLTSLTFDGAGGSGLNVSGVIASNTASGVQLIIATDAGNSRLGIVTLYGANTFAGGVVLHSGVLSLGNATALGANGNTLTINGGSVRNFGTVSLANNITLNGNLNYDFFSNSSASASLAGTMTLAGVLSGAGGLTSTASSADGPIADYLILKGANTYTGATIIRGPHDATAPANNTGGVTVLGATGSILSTASISISEGGALSLKYYAGHSAANTRVSASTVISISGGFLETIGNSGVVRQNLGTVNAGGLTTLLAGTGAAGSATEVMIANLNRGTGATVTFIGPNLGGLAVAPGLAAGQGNVILTQINGSAPGTKLVGGGGASGTTTISILPWAIGDSSSASINLAAGTGFVTTGANGVRLLNPVTEYNTTHNFSTAGANDNMRLATGTVTDPTAPTTVNSVFFSTTSGNPERIIGSSNILTLTSGALASSAAAATISAPVNFGAGGTREGIVSVIGSAGAGATMTLSGTITAASLVKSGHGALVLSGSGNSIGGALTVNSGRVIIPGVAQLGGASSLVFNGFDSFDGAGLTFTHTTGTETLTTPVLTSFGINHFEVTNPAATLALNSSIAGAGGIRKDGPGVLILGGNNSYSGGTYLVEGTVQIDSDARLGDASGVVQFAAPSFPVRTVTLLLTGDWNSSRAIGIDGPGVNNLDTQGNNVSLSGPITGTAVLTKQGSGTLTISGGAENYRGYIGIGDGTHVGGTIALVGAGALNSATVAFGSETTAAGLPGTYILDLSGATAISGTPWRSFTALGSSSFFAQSHEVKLGASAVAPVDLRVGSSGSNTFGGTAGFISGFGKFVKVGSGTFRFWGNNADTFTGDIEILGGILQIGADQNLGNGSNNILIAGGMLQAGNSITINRTITLGATPQPIINGSSVVLLANGIGAFTISGVIGGPGGLNAAGTTFTSAAGNTFAGDLQLGGTVIFTDNAQLGAASSRLRFNGGTLQLGAAPASPTTYAVGRTAIITATGNISVSNPNATLQLDGPLLADSTRTVFKQLGTGRLTIAGNSPSFFGTLTAGSGSPNTGRIALSADGQLRRGTVTLTTSVTPSASASLDMSGLVRELGGTNLNASTTLDLGSGGRLTTGFNNGNLTWAGNILGDSAAAFTKTGTGTLALTGNGNTLGGGFHLLSGVGATTLSGNGTLPAQSGFTVGAWGGSTNAGPSLLLDNTATNLGTRLADAQVIHSNAGVIQFTTNASTASSETVGSLRGAGMSLVTISTGGTLNFADLAGGLTRLQRGTFLFKGGALGAGPANTGRANLIFGNSGSFSLIGGGGVAGSTTVSILPFAAGDVSGSGGDTFVTYGADGIRPLNTGTEYQSNLGTAAANENVRTSLLSLTPVQISGGTNRTINSLVIAGAPDQTRIESAGSEALVLESGILLGVNRAVYAINSPGTVGLPLGVQTAELRTGAGNTRELNVFVTTEDLAIGAKVTTTGGLTKSGVSQLFLSNGANTYTGATTVNAGNLVIDSLAALGGSSVLQLGGGFLKYRGGDATLAQGIIAAGGEAANPMGGSAGFHIVSGTTLTASAGGISGYGGLLKDGSGVLKLTGANTYSGATIISGGALAIDTPGALGTNARVIFADGVSATGGQTLRFDAPMTLTQDFIANTAQAGVGFGFDTNGSNVTLSGTILDARSTAIRGLYKFGAGELNLTATEMYTGATYIAGGTLRLSGADGSIVNSTGTGGFNNIATVHITPGTTLVLDNAAANNNNRLPDVWDTPFGTGNGASGKIFINHGELKIIGNAAGTSERINSLFLHPATVTLQGGGTTLTSGDVAFLSAHTTGLIRGTNLGGTPGPASTNWFLTDLGSGGVQLVGAGGAEGTPFVSILRGFMGDTSATGSGTELVTYAADTGFRTLSAGEYTGVIPANNFDLRRAPNIALTGAGIVSQTTAITALKLGAGASLGGSGTLLLGASTVLATGSASLDVPVLSTNVSGAQTPSSFLTPGAGTNLTVNSTLVSATHGKYGAGTLTLNARSMATAIYVSQGRLEMGSASAALNPFAGLFVAPGATFDLGGSDRTLGVLIHINPIGSFNLGQINHGLVALGANRLTLYDTPSQTFTGDIAGTGGLNKAFFSTGTNTFTQPLSYTGPTVLRRGTIQLTGAGTLASTAVEIRGGTLLFNNTDDNATSGYVADRIGSGMPVTLAGGGLTFTENANTPGNHHLGAVVLEGRGTLTVTTGSAAPSTVTIANLTRSAAHGTLEISATNPGLTQSPTGNARIFLTQINGATPGAALIGGGGAVGTATQSILPWGWAFSTDSFLTYGTNGLRPLASSEFETNPNAPSSALANIRTTGNVTLTAPRTVNALLNSFGTLDGAFDLTLGSGMLAGGGLIGTNTNALLTGAGNTRELVLQTRFVTTLNYNITTSGGVTKFGLNPLTLTGANTFAGGLTINEGRVNFTANTQLGAAGGVIRFGGTAESSSLVYGGVFNAPFAFNRPVETTSFGTLTNSSTDRWQLNQPISGAGGIGYGTGSSIFEINAVNTYAGATNWTGGHLYINGDSAFGNGGELLLSAGSANNIVLRNGWTTSRPIHAASSSAIQTNGFNATWSGLLIGSSGVNKNGNGSLILTEAMPYSGALTVSAGEVRLKDRGSLAANASTHTINAGAALTLDDTATHFSDRLHDSSGGVTLNGGALTLLGNSGVTTEEVMNNLTLSAASAATVTVTAGSGQAAILRLAGTPTVNAGASLWRGTNLGVNTPGSANSATVILTGTNALQQSGLTGVTFLTGGAAPAGHPSISIVKGAFGDTSGTGLGAQLVTYDFDKGIRLLDPTTEYTTTLVNGSVVTDNVKADGSAIALANATTANALWLKDGGSVTSTGSLALTSGTLLVTGAGNTVSKTISAGGNTFAIGGPGDVTFNSAITSANTGGLIKMGAGTLTLAVASTYTGSTILAAGTLAVGSAGAFNNTAVQFQGGAIRNATAGPLTLTNNLTLNGTMTVSGAQDLTFGGTVSLANAARTFNVTNSGTTTISGVVSSSQTLLNYGLAKTGPGLLVLSNPANTYDGETTVSAGQLRVTGSIAASTLTTISGGTLSGTGTVGKLTLQSGVLAPGASAGTLNCGDLLFSGGAFAVEIASALSADKMNVTGTAGLGANTELGIALLSGFDPQPGNQWVIVDNNGTDPFATDGFRFTTGGAPIENLTPFTIGGETYQLEYNSGTGNDVVLSNVANVPEPAAGALLLAGLPLLLLRRRDIPDRMGEGGK